MFNGYAQPMMINEIEYLDIEVGDQFRIPKGCVIITIGDDVIIYRRDFEGDD